MPLNASFANQSEDRSVDVNNDADERAWADRIRAGDIAAFETLYRTYWQRLFAFAFRYVQLKEDAEEMVQEVFFRIWRGRAQWMPAGAVRNYLYLAVRNASRDRLERAAVARRLGRGGRVGQLATATEIQADLEAADLVAAVQRSEEHTSELQSQSNLVCRLLLEKKKTTHLTCTPTTTWPLT